MDITDDLHYLKNEEEEAYREALKLEISKPTLIKMCGNIFIDWLFGSIPLIGEIFDIGFKCNLRNARLIRKHIEKKLQKM